jgi:WD40 repeat protein
MNRDASHFVFLALLLTLCLCSVVCAGSDEQTPALTFDQHAERITSVSFSPDGRYVLTGSEDHSAKLWDVLTGEVIQSYEHLAGVRSVAFSPDGSIVATASPSYLTEDTGSVFLWSVETGELLATLPHYASVVSFSPDGEQIVTARGKVKFWDVDSKELIDTVECRGLTLALAYSPDGARLLVGCIDYISSDSSSGASDPGGSHEIAYLLRTDTKEIIAAYDEFGHYFGRPIAYSPEGSLYAMRSDSYPRYVHIFDAKTLSVVSIIETKPSALAFSPDGKKILVDASLYDTESRQLIGVLPGYEEGVALVNAFSPDGTKVVIARGTLAKVWDVSNLVASITDWAVH